MAYSTQKLNYRKEATITTTAATRALSGVFQTQDSRFAVITVRMSSIGTGNIQVFDAATVGSDGEIDPTTARALGTAAVSTTEIVIELDGTNILRNHLQVYLTSGTGTNVITDVLVTRQV